jgi:hypothetical protein
VIAEGALDLAHIELAVEIDSFTIATNWSPTNDAALSRHLNHNVTASDNTALASSNDTLVALVAEERRWLNENVVRIHPDRAVAKSIHEVLFIAEENDLMVVCFRRRTNVNLKANGLGTS